jgi:two-component system nitrogen regulation response regulator NtrX
VIVAINNALNFRRLEEENRYLRRKMIEKNSINGNSAPIQELRKQIAMAAPTDSTILITGENGTGKELVARTIHQLSNRATHPLVTVNCAAIPEDLIESELFGHEKGVFSGVSSKKRGKFEVANTGTIFLDEIGDMSLKTQAKILRVLQEQKFHRVGGSRILSVDVRVIAASNKGLEKEIENGNFREDLYYRLNVIPIYVPSLKERLEDIPLLVETFLAEYAKKNLGIQRRMSDKALALLQRYHWPGNVRELKNLIERLVIMTRDEKIDAEILPEPYNPRSLGNRTVVGTEFMSIDDIKEAKKAFEKEFIKLKLDQHHNNITKTAEAIGVGRSYLHKKIRELDK